MLAHCPVSHIPHEHAHSRQGTHVCASGKVLVLHDMAAYVMAVEPLDFSQRTARQDSSCRIGTTGR